MKAEQGLIKYSVKNKLVLAFAIILLLPSAAIGWISYTTAKDKVDDQMKRAASEDVNLLNETITQIINAKISEVNILSEEISLGSTGSNQGIDDPKVKEKLDRFLRYHPELEGIIVGTEEGRYQFSPSSVMLPSDYDPRERPWYKQAMENKGKVIITDPYIMQGTHKVVLSIAKVASDGHGVIAPTLDLKTLDTIVKGVKVSNQGYIFLADAKRKFLSHPTQPTGGELKASFTDTIYNSDSGEIDYINPIDGKSKKMVFTTNRLTGWKIMGTWYKEEVVQEAAPIFNATILVTSIALLAGAAFVFFIIRSLPSPQLERKYQILYELSPLAILLLDQKARIHDANPAALQLFEMSAGEIKLQGFPSLMAPNDRNTFIRQLESGLLNEKSGNSEFRIVINDQEQRLVSAESEFITIAGEQFQYVILRDITEQKRTLQMLEESVDRYTSLESYNPDSVVSLSLDGMVMSVNPATERIFGYPAAQLIGKHFTESMNKEDAENSLSLFHRIVFEKLLSSSELRVRHRTGDPLDLLVTPAPIYIMGNMVGCYIISKDITEQKRKDELLMKSEKLSIAGQLAAGIAHEIRNPLTAIKGFVQMMGSSEAYNPKYLQIIREEMERIELIIRELLMLAKPQAIQMKQEDLRALIEDVILLIEAQAILQNIEIRLNPADQNCFIQCDANQIKQVFINFFKNAIEAMPRGGVIQVNLEISSDHEAVVQIKDQGCGISEKQLRLIGEPFYSTKEAGTGLGMLVSYKIIENHGGCIRIFSQMDLGTTIVVTLPAIKGTNY
ncbi:PAS domain S-box protein [Cohnella sp.]|uniref:PAS domain S-box protein n=1 Tax=Cohnella sp. TaxID=1883426 RepID=UPI00356ADC01